MSRQSDKERHALELIDMGQARCIREAAFMLVLARIGTEFESDTITGVWDNVAAVAAEHGASPEDVQSALETHEPTLAIGAAL